MAKGDHLLVSRARGLYSHHGIDCGDDTIIHYTSDRWLDPRRVQRTDMRQFALLGEIELRDYSAIRDAVSDQTELQTDTRNRINQLLDVIRGLPGLSWRAATCSRLMVNTLRAISSGFNSTSCSGPRSPRV